MFTADTMQANLGFVVSQTAHIEASVYKIKYTGTQYQDLIPVDTSANEWATSVTYFSMDSAGQARWVNGRANDVPLVGTRMEKFDTSVHMAGIGYDFSIEEVNQARMLGIALGNEKALAARTVYERFVDGLALNGDAAKGYEGLFSYTGVPQVSFTADGTGSSALWSAKSAALILRDVNALLTGVVTATGNTGMANTLLLPIDRFTSIASRQLDNTSMTVLEFIQKSNAYTATTGQKLEIRGCTGLDTKGSGGTARSIAYRKAPEVLKLHAPMPLRFLPPQLIGLTYQIPGMFRLGGLDIRLPKEVRYGDGL